MSRAGLLGAVEQDPGGGEVGRVDERAESEHDERAGVLTDGRHALDLGEVEVNLISMSELAMTNNIKVILCSVLPAKDFPWRPGLEPAEKVVELNKLLQSYVQKHKLVYVDYFSAMVDDSKGMKKDLAYDGVHPTALGYSIMEPLVEDGIAKALKED
jgi:hypothetical protein